MNHIKKITAILLAVAAMPVSAATYEVTAGDLGSTVVVSESETELVLTGTIDASDLHYIATTCKGLKLLDLSGAKIVRYNGGRLVGNNYSHASSVLSSGILSGLQVDVLRLPSSLTGIASCALMGSTVSEVTIPSGVTWIGNGAFADCRNLKEISVSDKVTSIGTHTFAECTSLAKVTWGATYIPERAFSGCTSLSEVTITGAVTTVNAGAFAGCISLAGISMPSALVSIGSNAFAESGLKEINLSTCERLTSIGARAFAGCGDLQKVTLPSSLQVIGQGVFFDDTALSSVTIPAAVKTIPAMAFKGMTAVGDASQLIGSNTTSIGNYAMAGMTEATQVTIPASVTYIGNGAFEDWNSLVNIDARALTAVPELGEEVWDGVNKSEVVLSVDPSMGDLFLAAPQWQDFNIKLSGSSGITAPPVENKVSVRFDGDMLLVHSDTGISEAMVHDINALRLALESGTGMTDLSLDTSAATSPYLLLTVVFDNGTTTSLKLKK